MSVGEEGGRDVEAMGQGRRASRWRRALGRLRRDGEVPAQVMSAVSATGAGRVLAAAQTADGGWAVGTAQRFVLVGADGTVEVDRQWWQVDTAAWDDEEGVLSVRWITGRTSWVQPRAAGSAPARRLLQLARERVDASIAAAHRVQVRGVGGARLVARRVGSGLVVQVLPDPGTDLDDPRVAAAVTEGRSVLEDQVGPLH